MKQLNWKRYLLEFSSIFIAVISAFALNNWNDNRQDSKSEEKILWEIKNGIKLDIKDFNGNMYGHRQSLRITQRFRDLINNKPVNQDTIQRDYIILFRDYTPIINLSGYESLKASGLKIIKNDSLRFQIISLYDFYYDIILKVEDGYEEMRSFPNYFEPINTLLHEYMEFDDKGRFLRFNQPIRLSEKQKKEVLSYFWRLEVNRRYKLQRYNLIQEKMKQLKADIEKELGHAN